jgi:hypothetical protein
MAYVTSGGQTPPAHLKRTLTAAQEALEKCENSFYDIEAGAGDAEDARLTLEHVLTESSSNRLSEIAISGRELARQSVALVGGAFLPDLTDDPTVAIRRPLGVALVSTCLSMVAVRMVNRDLSGGIRMEAQDLGSQAEITIAADELPAEVFQDVVAELSLHTGDAPSVTVQAADGRIRLLFAVVRS